MKIEHMERKIKDKHLRIGIEKSVEHGIICNNVLICCIATLNDYINRSAQNQVVYSQRRNYLAKQAKQYMDTEELRNKVYTLSPECYPSLKATERVSNMLADNSKEKIIDNFFVSDALMRYLTIEEAEKFHKNKSDKIKSKEKLESFISNDKDFIEICNLVKKDFNIDLTVNMQKEISSLMCNGYNFSVVLKTLQFNESEILDLICKKEFNSKYAKFKYLLTIIESRLQDTLEYMQQAEKAEKEIERIDLTIATYDSGAKYQRKSRECSKALNDLW